MINRFLLSVGLVFLVFSAVSLFILVPLLRTPPRTSGKIPLSQPTVCGGGGCGSGFAFLISQGTLSFDLEVEYEWPKKMDRNGSESISVALTVPTPPASPYPSPTPIGNISDRGVNTLRPDSLGAEASRNCAQEGITDPRLCQISNIFGKGYKMSTASAYLVTTSFDTQLLGPLERSVDQPLIEWDWNIFPKSVGSQVITAGIDLQWTPTSSGRGATILRQLWEVPITIEVDQPFLDIGQLSLSSVISGAFGLLFTGVSLPWILGQRQQKQEQKKNKIKYCQSCGVKNLESFVYCNQCGEKRTHPPNVITSTQSIPSSPEVAEEKTPASAGDTAIVQQTLLPSSSQENGKLGISPAHVELKEEK